MILTRLCTENDATSKEMLILLFVAIKCLMLERENMHTLNMTGSQQMQVKGLI